MKTEYKLGLWTLGFIIVGFMMTTESVRIKHSYQIEELQEQFKSYVKQLDKSIPEHKKWRLSNGL